jgi:hypothetical protein
MTELWDHGQQEKTEEIPKEKKYFIAALPPEISHDVNRNET